MGLSTRQQIIDTSHGCLAVEESGRAVSTNILHFFARVVVFTCPDRLTAAAPFGQDIHPCIHAASRW